MSTEPKFIVLPFRRARNRLVLGDLRQATSRASADRLARSLADRIGGARAYEVQVEEENGEMHEPRLICAHGETFDVMAEA